jgi:hypothetical protein
MNSSVDLVPYINQATAAKIGSLANANDIPDFHFWEALLVWHGDGSKGVTELARSEVDPVITWANLFPSSK